MFEQPMVVLAAIAVIGVLCQWSAWLLKLPPILLLLLAGIVAGPVTGFLDPDRLFGDLLFPLVSLGVAVVLFEGSLRLRFHEIRGLARVVRNLVSVGALINWLIIALTTHLLLGLPWELAFLFGAVVVVTGPTVITPMLMTIRPTAGIANILRWEGIIIDPLGALLAVLVFEFIVSGQEGGTLGLFSGMVLTGLVAGLVPAFALAAVLRRRLLPDYLVNVATLALVLGVFTLAHTIVHESGLLAVTIMGIALANMRDVPIEEVVDFKESLSVIIISTLFIILAGRLDPGQLLAMGWPALLLLGVILFVARPSAVALATLGSSLDWRERALIGWVGPRGIVAAAVSSLFALRLESLGTEQAAWLVPLTFMVIIGTVVIQGLTARPLADLLGVSEPEPKGVLIVGGGRVARAVAKVLTDKGFRTLIADTDWEAIRAARMEGLPTYFGNAVSEHADRHLDRVGIGALFAMTRRPAYNALACLRFRRDFGADRVFSVRMPEEKGASEKRTIARPYTCPRLFGEEVTLTKLASLLSQGAEIHTTLLTEDFDFGAYREKYRHRALPLFALTPKGRLRIFTTDSTLEPESGWSIIGLLPEPVLERPRKAADPAEA